MRKATEFRIDIGDIELAVVEWAGESDPVLLLHATGFHSRCWNQVVELLPGQHIYAADLRFHGGSGDVGEVNWGVLADDICTLLERRNLSNVVAAGHSIGGHLITRAAAMHPERFKQLLLIDPVILNPETYAIFQELIGDIQATDHPVSRRKNRWLNAEEMYERFRERPPFDTWQDAVLRDYCDFALHPADEEGYRQLACDPINEASLYVNQVGNEVVFDLLPRVSTPVTLMRARAAEKGIHDLSHSPTWTGLAAALPCCREIYLPDMNHFIPMQDPALVANYIREAQQNLWQHQQASAG